MRSIIAVFLGILFAFLLIFNAYLLFSIRDGARIVRNAEAATGHPLNCLELYDTQSIEAYFYPERARQGEIIYLAGILFPVWLGVSVGLPLALTVVLGKEKRWHWFPPVIIAPLILMIVLQSGMLAKLVCALE